MLLFKKANMHIIRVKNKKFRLGDDLAFTILLEN